MKLEFYLWGFYTSPGIYPLLKTVTTFADGTAISGLLITDHYMGELGESTYDSWITLSALAPLTEKLRLGTMVTPIPLRPPQVLAKIVATLDDITSGRVILGIGAGWNRREFEGFGVWDEAKIRVDRVREGVELLLKLWGEPEVNFEGQFYHVKGAVLEPKPYQKPHPPLLFGGRGERMLRLAGRYADIVYRYRGDDLKSYEEARQWVEESARKHGREGNIAYARASRVIVPPDQYNPSDHIRELESLIQTGANPILIRFNADKDYMQMLKLFTKEVLPSFT